MYMRNQISLHGSHLASSIYSPCLALRFASFLLFGIIASSGLRILIDNKIDFGDKRNLVIASVILTIGVGSAIIKVERFELHGMTLVAIIGVVLNIVLPKENDEKSDKRQKDTVA